MELDKKLGKGKSIVCLAIDTVAKELVHISIYVVNMETTVVNDSKGVMQAIKYAKTIITDKEYIPVDVVGVYCHSKNSFDWEESTPDYMVEEITY